MRGLLEILPWSVVCNMHLLITAPPPHLLASKRGVRAGDILTGFLGKLWVDTVLAVVQEFLQKLERKRMKRAG